MFSALPLSSALGRFHTPYDLQLREQLTRVTYAAPVVRLCPGSTRAIGATKHRTFTFTPWLMIGKGSAASNSVLVPYVYWQLLVKDVVVAHFTSNA